MSALASCAGKIAKAALVANPANADEFCTSAYGCLPEQRLPRVEKRNFQEAGSEFRY